MLHVLGRGDASDWNQFDEGIKNLFLPQVLLLKGQQSNSMRNSLRESLRYSKLQSKKNSSKKSLASSSSEETTSKGESNTEPEDSRHTGSSAEFYAQTTTTTGGMRKSPSFEDSLKTLGGSSGDENSNAVSEDPTFPYPRYDSVDDFSAFEAMSRDMSAAPRAFPNTMQRMQELCEAQSVQSDSCWTEEDMPEDEEALSHESVSTEQLKSPQRKVTFTEKLVNEQPKVINQQPSDFKITCLSAAKQGLLHEANTGKHNPIKSKETSDMKSTSDESTKDRLSDIPSVIYIDWNAPTEVPQDEPLWRGFVPNVYNNVRDNTFHSSMKSISSLPSQDSKNMVSRLRRSLNLRKQQKTLFGDNDSASVKKLLRLNFE